MLIVCASEILQHGLHSVLCLLGRHNKSLLLHKFNIKQKLRLKWWHVFVYFSSFEVYIFWTHSIFDGSWRPLYPMTLLFILLRSSVVKSPFHILFNICPYSGSSLNRWLLSSIIIALMQLSQCLLDKLKIRGLTLLIQQVQVGGSLQKIWLSTHQKVWLCCQFLSVLHQVC